MTESETGSVQQIAGKSSAFWQRTGKFLASLAIVIAVAYATAAGYMYLNQRSFVFVPTGELSDPAEKGLKDVDVETVAMADGTGVTVWSAEASLAGAPTVLYFHGNSSNVSARWKRFKQILDSGFGLYAPSYRGYPGSEGTPSEEALISDALEHFDRLSQHGTPIVVHGESLGSGIAAAVAEKRDTVDLLVLEAPYTALVDMAYESYPWLPVGLLMKDQMPTRDRIGNIEAPVLIVHGTDDGLIPVEHGKRLHELAADPKQLVLIEGGGHGDLWTSGLWQAVLNAWNEVSQSTGKA